MSSDVRRIEFECALRGAASPARDHTYTRHSTIRTSTLIERSFDSAKTQAAFVDLTFDFGGKPKDPGFDYSG